MKVETVPFLTEHLNAIRVMDIEKDELRVFKEENFKYMEKGGKSFTILIDGKVKACFGIVDMWEGRAEAWTLFDSECKNCFVTIYKVVKRKLKTVNVRRLEAHILQDFEAGHRWIKLLGFELEAPVLKKYGITGKDYSLYAIVK